MPRTVNVLGDIPLECALAHEQSGVGGGPEESRPGGYGGLAHAQALLYAYMAYVEHNL